MIEYAPDGSSQALFHIIDEDDRILLESSDNAWYSLLYFFPWQTVRQLGADYYTALGDFNRKQTQRREDGSSVASVMDFPTNRKNAATEFLFNRDTMKAAESEKNVLYKQEVVVSEEGQWHCSTEQIAPGCTPPVVVGRQPKCFFALFKAYLGTLLQGHPAHPKTVHQLLSSNPAFARVCGFVIPKKGEPYDVRHIPSLRKLEQFDQLMTDYGLWSKAKIAEVIRNLENGVIKPESTIVGDTTHYFAYSGFQTIEYTDEKGKVKRKSQSKMTKQCTCKDHNTCPHEWVSADDGAATVVKSNKKMYWAHKASIIGFPGQDIPLDMVAIDDSATNDGLTFLPHIDRLLSIYKGLELEIDTALYDSACDIEKLREKLWNDYSITLKTTVNPGRLQTRKDDLPKGIAAISPYGTVTCKGGYEMQYQGRRKNEGVYIFTAPKDSAGQSVCVSCPLNSECCNNANTTGRRVQLSWDDFPAINPNDPQIATRFKEIMKQRPAVERMIKRLKCDISSPYLKKRGNKAFQAYLDKTMMAYHILLRFRS